MRNLGSFLVKLVAILTLMAVMFLVLNHKWLKRYATQYQKPTETSIQGQWIGIVDAKAREPNPAVHKKAVLRFTLGLTNSHLNWYGGETGTIFFPEDGTSRVIRIGDLKPLPDGTFTGVLIGGTDAELNEAGKSDIGHDFSYFLGNHYFNGTLQGNDIVFSEIKWPFYSYSGTLHHGSDQQFAMLCDSVRGQGK